MSGSRVIARIYGIPIKVHITLWIMLAFVALSALFRQGFSGLLFVALIAAGLFTSVALHEVGHSVVAMRKGCRVREILLLPIGGMAQLEGMPTRPRDEFQIAIAGPAVSFALALVFGALTLLVGLTGFTGLSEVLALLAGINVMLTLFNLLPSFPMDGGRIFRAWMTPRVGRVEATRLAAKIGRFMAVGFGIFAILPPFEPILLVIAIFVYMAAGAEYRMVRIQEAYRHHQSSPWAPFTTTEPDGNREFTVSPPPYQRGHTSRFIARPVRMQHDLFDELFRKWH